MEILHENSLWIIEFNSSENLFLITWTSNTERMKDVEFKTELLQYLELVKKHQPQKVLLDTSLFLYVVAPNIQEWVDAEINSQVSKYGVQKIAFLMTEDIFAQVAMEQTAEEHNANKLLDILFFDDKNKALEWLNS